MKSVLLVLFSVIVISSILIGVMLYENTYSKTLGIKCNFDYTWCGFFDHKDNFIPSEEADAKMRLGYRFG